MFRAIILESAIEEASNTISLATSKSPVTSIEIIKYKTGRYGVLNFSMQDSARKFLTKNGFEIKGSVLYPSKSYESKEDMLKDVKDLFGINPKLIKI